MSSLASRGSAAKSSKWSQTTTTGVLLVLLPARQAGPILVSAVMRWFSDSPYKLGAAAKIAVTLVAGVLSLSDISGWRAGDLYPLAGGGRRFRRGAFCCSTGPGRRCGCRPTSPVLLSDIPVETFTVATKCRSKYSSVKEVHEVSKSLPAPTVVDPYPTTAIGLPGLLQSQGDVAKFTPLARIE